jgi:cytochrome d ubiquinol oxidase subunit I
VAAERVDDAVAIPGGLSFLIHEDFHADVPGLEEFPKDQWPNVPLVFETYHLMVGLGTVFIGLTLLALFFLWRGTLFEQRWLMVIFVFAVVGPYLANQAGWVSAEAGHQPFIVYPQVTWPADGSPHPHMETGPGSAFLKTADGLSSRRVVGSDQVLGSIVMFSLIYVGLFAVWVYVLNDKIRHGPEETTAAPPRSTTTDDLVETAARRLDKPSGYSLTEPRRGVPGETVEESVPPKE